MISEVDKNTWDDCVGQFTSNLMFKSHYLEIVSTSFNTKIKYLLLRQNGDVVLALSVFHKNKRVYNPENYSYTPLWLQNSYSERKKNEFLRIIIVFLKTNFKRIDLKLRLEDLRAFKWEGFTVEPRYTYLRLKDTNAHKSIKARLSRGGKVMPIIEVQKPSEDDINLNINFLKELKIGKQNIVYNECLLHNLNNAGYLKSFTIKVDHQSVCAFIVLLDEKQKQAFTLMINGADRGNEYFHALLYKQMLTWFDQQGFEFVDFCGANMKGISEFKSYFNPQLVSYYVVRYSYVQQLLRPFLNLIAKF